MGGRRLRGLMFTRWYRGAVIAGATLAVLLAAGRAVGSAWMQPQGSLSLAYYTYFHFTRESFCPDHAPCVPSGVSLGSPTGRLTPGEKGLLFSLRDDPSGGREFMETGEKTGRSQMEGFALNLRYGVTNRFEISADVPYYRLRVYNKTWHQRRSVGWGDIKVRGKVLLLREPLAVAPSFGVKMATGKREEVSTAQFVGAGQWDLEYMVDISRSLWPIPVFVSVTAGFRDRRMDEETLVTPGNEYVLVAEGGYRPLHRVTLQMAYDATWGGTETRGLKGSSSVRKRSRRRIAYLVPSAAFTLSRRAAAFALVRIPLGGINHMAGNVYTLGIDHRVF